MASLPDCQEIKELLSALSDDELDARRRKLIAAHLLTCPDCSRDAGRVMATKGLAQRDEPDADVPPGFMQRVQERLDAVDGVRERVNGSRPTRRLTVIAAVGAIAVSLALILSTVYFIRDDRALELAQIHQQLVASTARGAGPAFTVISCDPARDDWEEVRQALMRFDGRFVNYSLYRVGGCPVSVFEGPQGWEPYRTGWLVTERLKGFDVRRVGDQAMASWEASGHSYVLTAGAPPDLTPELARAYMRTVGRSPGL